MPKKGWLSENFEHAESFKLNSEAVKAINWLSDRMRGNSTYTKRFLVSLAIVRLAKEIKETNADKHFPLLSLLSDGKKKGLPEVNQ